MSRQIYSYCLFRGEREMKFKKLLAKKKTGISWVVILELFNRGEREIKF